MLYNPPFAFKRSRDEWFPVAPGGPLCEGDIEEVEGVLQVFCPWHDYNFDLRTGKSGTSLQVGDETRSNSGSITTAHLLKKKEKTKTKPKCSLKEDAQCDRDQTDSWRSSAGLPAPPCWRDVM